MKAFAPCIPRLSSFFQSFERGEPLKEKKRYDSAKKANAYTRFSMRVLVAAYILYMAVKLVLNSASGVSSMPLWLGWVFCGVFALLGAFFVVYSLRRLKSDIADAVESAEDESSEK